MFVEEMQRIGEALHPIKPGERLQVFLETDEEEDPAQLLSLFDAYLEERMIEAPRSRWLSPKAKKGLVTRTYSMEMIHGSILQATSQKFQAQNCPCSVLKNAHWIIQRGKIQVWISPLETYNSKFSTIQE